MSGRPHLHPDSQIPTAGTETADVGGVSTCYHLAAEARGRRKRVRTKTQRHSSMMEKNREPDAIGDQQEMEATAEGDTALPPSSLTRKDSSSFSVKLAVWARSHRSITRGSSNSAREQGVVCLDRSQGRTHPGAGGPHGLSARGISVCVASWEH